MKSTKRIRTRIVNIVHRPKFILGDITAGIKEGERSYACCPYDNLKNEVEWTKLTGYMYGWKINSRCPHLVDFSRSGLSFYKDDSVLRTNEDEYINRFGRDITKTYKYWYFYPFTQKQCAPVV